MSHSSNNSLPPTRTSRRQRGLSPLPTSRSLNLSQQHLSTIHSHMDSTQPEYLISYPSQNETYPSIINTIVDTTHNQISQPSSFRRVSDTGSVHPTWPQQQSLAPPQQFNNKNTNNKNTPHTFPPTTLHNIIYILHDPYLPKSTPQTLFLTPLPLTNYEEPSPT